MGSVEEQNKALARRYYGDIMNGGRLDVIDELTTPDFFFSIPTHPKPFYGPQGLKDEVTMLHGAFPDVHIQVELLRLGRGKGPGLESLRQLFVKGVGFTNTTVARLQVGKDGQVARYIVTIANTLARA